MFVVVCLLGGKLAPDPRLGYTISQDGDWKVAANGIEFEAGINILVYMSWPFSDLQIAR